MSGSEGYIQYYKPLKHGCVVRNPWIIPFIMEMNFNGFRVPREGQLKIFHSDNDTGECYGSAESLFHTVYCENTWMHPRFQYTRMIRMRLEGTRNSKDVFAILEAKMNQGRSWDDCIFTLSPVPFGPNGKPILPDYGNKHSTFLCIMEAVLSVPVGTIWSMTCESENVRLISCRPFVRPVMRAEGKLICAEWFECFKAMDALGLVTWHRDSMNYVTKFTAAEVQEIFGIHIVHTPESMVPDFRPDVGP